MSVSLWSYFDKLGGSENKEAVCRLCKKIYCYKTTIYNLKHHLINKHNNELDVEADSLVNIVHKKAKSSGDSSIREYRSPIWNFFTATNNGESAICTLCSKTLSYRTTITNLKSHLKNQHSDAYETLSQSNYRIKSNIGTDDQYEEEFLEIDEEYEEAKPSTEDGVWDYFENETGGRARCVVCRRSVPNEVAELKAHLQEKHPKLAGVTRLSDQTEDVKVYLNIDDSYPEDVHIDSDDEKPRKSGFKTHSKSTTPQRIKKKRIHCETSSDDEYLATTKRKNGDEGQKDLDVFLKYVGTLLKDIPKDLFTKLQCNIINMIMTTKINYESASTDAPKAQNSEYYVISNKLHEIPPADVTSRSIVIQVPTNHEMPSSSDVSQNNDKLNVSDNEEATSQVVIENVEQNSDNQPHNVGQTIDMHDGEWTISASSHET